MVALCDSDCLGDDWVRGSIGLIWHRLDTRANVGSDADYFYGMIDAFQQIITDAVEGTQTDTYAIWTNEGDVVLDGDGDGAAGGTDAVRAALRIRRAPSA